MSVYAVLGTDVSVIRLCSKALSHLISYGCQHPSSFAGGFFVLIKNKDDLT